MPRLKRYPIHETFFSWQGEGVHMGRAAFFVRTFGCPVRCPWCDSAGTWHEKYTPSHIEKMTIAELLGQAHATEAEFIVVTGGEPALHDWSPFIKKSKLPVHLETSGGYPIKGDFAWVTISPKWAAKRLPEAFVKANELKIIVEDKMSVSQWWADLNPILSDMQSLEAIWLHPEWSKRDDKEIKQTINRTIKLQGGKWRAGYQLHKLFRVDEEDGRTRPQVPLGGNLEHGF